MTDEKEAITEPPWDAQKQQNEKKKVDIQNKLKELSVSENREVIERALALTKVKEEIDSLYKTTNDLRAIREIMDSLISMAKTVEKASVELKVGDTIYKLTLKA